MDDRAAHQDRAAYPDGDVGASSPAGFDPRVHHLRQMDCRVTPLRVGPAMTELYFAGSIAAALSVFAV